MTRDLVTRFLFETRNAVIDSEGRHALNHEDVVTREQHGEEFNLYSELTEKDILFHIWQTLIRIEDHLKFEGNGNEAFKEAKQ